MNRGAEQAGFISPIKSAFDLGLRPTNHTDYAVTPIDQLFTIWSAVNRISRKGILNGPEQRITVRYQALQAITINAAYQYFEEKTKGSIEVGKLADLVVLDKNPLKVDPMAISRTSRSWRQHQGRQDDLHRRGPLKPIEDAKTRPTEEIS